MASEMVIGHYVLIDFVFASLDETDQYCLVINQIGLNLTLHKC
jgi:hypothetical protein